MREEIAVAKMKIKKSGRVAASKAKNSFLITVHRQIGITGL